LGNVRNQRKNSTTLHLFHLLQKADFQKITNHAYNSARVPIDIISLWMHFEL